LQKIFVDFSAIGFDAPDNLFSYRYNHLRIPALDLLDELLLAFGALGEFGETATFPRIAVEKSEMIDLAETTWC